MPVWQRYIISMKRNSGFQGTGMYMVEYAIHKVTIAIFSIIFFLLNFGFMKEHYSEYFNLLIAGYALTAVIATALLYSAVQRSSMKFYFSWWTS